MRTRYDNDRAVFRNFQDYKVDNEHNAEMQWKENLLHKQIEAIWQSNIDTNFPWKLFDKKHEKRSKRHSFNCAQVTHLKSALSDNGIELPGICDHGMSCHDPAVKSTSN